ncbi:MAG: hypothetical protein Q9162_005445 [Coniocarpon cinnabarinum]
MAGDHQPSTTPSAELCNRPANVFESSSMVSFIFFGPSHGGERSSLILWSRSVLLSTVVIMESFDVVATTGFFKLESFQKTFGKKSGVEVSRKLDTIRGIRSIDRSSECSEVEEILMLSVQEYYVPASSQSGIVNAVLCGEIIGLILCGWVTERAGLRWTLVCALVALSVFLFLLFFAKGVGMFIAGQFLSGVPLGVFQTLPVNYAQDILPDSLKPFLTTYVNFCWALGGLLGSAVQRATMHIPGDWSWRLPIALQWIWPVPLVLGIVLAPESPVWLVRSEKEDEAMHSLHRLTPKPDETYEVIARTNAHEKELTAGVQYRDCFRGINMRRTETTCMAWANQMVCGSTLMYFATSFFQEAGISSDTAYTLTPVLYAVGCVGTFVSWFLIACLKRRTLYLAGNFLMAVILFGMGIVGVFPGILAANWAAAVSLIAFTLVYDCTIGPVCYCLVGELPSSRLKQKTVPIARCVYLLLSIILNFLIPPMLGREEGEW